MFSNQNNNHFFKTLFFMLGFLFVQKISAQVKNENLGTEVVNVVKPYTPTIADAIKIKEKPVLEDTETEKKPTLIYSIVSVPVASTFTPSKGRAAAVEQRISERLYDNFASLGFGSFATADATLSVTKNLDDGAYFNGMLNHLSSQGKIKDVLLENKFYDTKLDLTYGVKQNELSWKGNATYRNQVYNWYGLPVGFASNLTPQNQSLLISTINPSHTFHDFGLGGSVNLLNSDLNEVQLEYSRFWDSYNSAENSFTLKPVFSIDAWENKLKIKTAISYQNTKFERFYQANNNVNPSNESGFFTASVNPNYEIIKNDLTLNVGAELTYLNTLKNVIDGTDFGSKGGLYFYPKVSASYNIVTDIMIGYGTIQGGLNHNSYKNFINENPFVSPTLNISPTDNLYGIQAGLRGKLSTTLGYDVSASYNNEKNKALFKNNSYDPTATNLAYENGNSFGLVYDDVRTIKITGSLEATFVKIISLGINVSYYNYNQSNEVEAWNLPNLTFGSKLNVQFSKKWSAGTQLFFVGERKDQLVVLDLGVLPNVFTKTTKTLDGFFDANANINFQHSNRLNVFLRANNIASQQYQKWLNFHVQGLQLLLGAGYRFDF
jgi:hypothetical protein